MSQSINEKNAASVEINNEPAKADQPQRARLTVEVPTEITAGVAKRGGPSCFCSRTYCCS